MATIRAQRDDEMQEKIERGREEAREGGSEEWMGARNGWGDRKIAGTL